MAALKTAYRSALSQILSYCVMVLGAFLAAFAIEVFFIPNNLIDGGVVGISMIMGTLFGNAYIPLFLIFFNLPFLYLAWRWIGKTFLIHMFVAVFLFSFFLIFNSIFFPWDFHGESLEVVVIGGAILGIGIGLIIRVGGSLDGTEILGIILNKQTGFTVGQVVLVCNVFIFGAAGIVFRDWHPPILSLITYLVAIKVMDAVIVGLDETKSVMIVSKKSDILAEEIIHQLELGLTVMYGRGGYSGEDSEILYVICERLQLSELKELVFQKDPNAFLAIENLNEVANGMRGRRRKNRNLSIRRVVSRILAPKKTD